MTTPVSQAAISVPHYQSPVQENKLPQAGAGSAPESAAHAGAKELLGHLGLNPDLITDEKDKKSILDVIDKTCKKTMDGYDENLEAMNEEQRQRQSAMADLSSIDSTLGEYRSKHPAATGEIDLTNTEVTLQEGSAFYAEGKRTMMLSELTDFYRKNHPELLLPEVPTTISELEFTQGQVKHAVSMTLEPASQKAYTELQRCMQERTAMWSLQSMMYHIIYDAFKKLNP